MVLMRTNTNMTLYHKRYNKEKGYDEWDKYLIENVMWQGGRGASVNKGYEKANDIDIFIPYSKNDLSKVKFAIGDIVTKGETEDITKQSDLKVESYNILTIIDYNYGTNNVNHIQLGAK